MKENVIRNLKQFGNDGHSGRVCASVGVRVWLAVIIIYLIRHIYNGLAYSLAKIYPQAGNKTWTG